MPTNLEYALRYRRRGFSIIPCKTDKKPLIKWEPYQLQKPTEDEIKQWWSKWPNANIAIVCGAVSGVDVLDVDTQEAYEALNDFHLPESFLTPAVKTPKGRHLYFKHKPGLTNKVRAVPGTDLRTTGGYVVAPPSRNGDSIPYTWFDGLAPKDLGFSDWPDQLFGVLQQASFSSPYNNSSSLLVTKEYIVSNNHANSKPQTTTQTTNDHKFFVEGRRDQDLFHAANCLIKGKCERDFAYEVLKILGKNCDPPFDEKEIETKLKSAEGRQNIREKNLAAEIREWVATTNGYFSTTNGHNELQTTTKEEKKNFNMVMLRLVAEGVIEKHGNKNGYYRRIEDDCQPLDWVNASCEYRELWMPLGLGEICGVQPGNVLVLAGAKDSGKTAFLMNIAKENRHNYKVHYFNSEMGVAEWKMRASKFDDITIEQFARGVSLYDRNANFADVVKPGEGNLNIIDFLEVPDEVWRVGSMIQKIHAKLDGALCVIALQKKIGQDLGRGAEFSMEKARLYVSLDYQKAKIVSCKNFKENDIIRGNPRGYTTQYKLVNGCKIIKSQQGWTSPADKEVL